jgi:hypothetical protein
MGDVGGAFERKLRAEDPELLARLVDLLGIGFTFPSPEHYDMALEWAARAYRAGQATTRNGRRCPAHVQLPGATGPADQLAYCRLKLGHDGGHEIAVGEPATPDGPRRWALPDEPGPEVTAVRGGSQTIYRRVGPHWQDGAHRVVESWWEILADAPLTDATPAADGQDGDGRG